MSTTAPNHFLPQLTDGIHHRFQSKGFTLRNTTRPPSRVTSNTAQWNRIGLGTASELNRNDKVPPMNLGKDNVQGTMKEYGAFEHIYIADVGKLTYNEMEEAKKGGAMALGRKCDQIIMDAVHAGAGTSGNYVTADGTPAAFKLELLQEGISQIQDREAWEDDAMFLPLPPRAYQQLMTYKEFSSADYVGPDYPYMNAKRRKTFLGVHCFQVPLSLFPVTSNVVEFFLWNMEAVGQALDQLAGGQSQGGEMEGGDAGQTIKTDLVRLSGAIAWELQMWFQGCAKVIDAEGIQRFKFNKTSAITRNT